ncbi:hypothetical protein C6P46_004162 [Rhodotorula mucilaginosa]|uniref:Uncharacterized protein n=1 Tax=Rhodotorula mucilaginosa TaxID=5537 RepID=A0A9P7B5Q3_RHOMI|nr:hypothetical protein C6P46_004162 [Rhodotorula mucilaginosa]TKA51844.1 hypothetical protein B0A53_05196 [Rhodotorula sp. CCFEE 5036]
MGTQVATSVAPIDIHSSVAAPHILLSSPPSNSSSPVPPPPSPASIPNAAAPTLARRAVFDLRSSSPLSPSAGEKTLLKAQLERAKHNRVLLRNGKPARPLSRKEWRRLTAADDEAAETSSGGATVAEGCSTGSHTPLSLSDSDRNSVAGLLESIGGLLSGEDKTPEHEIPPADSPMPVIESSMSILPLLRGGEGSVSSSAASSLYSPSASPPRRSAPPKRPAYVTRLSRTAPTTPSISPTSHLSSLLSRRPSVKVELTTAFATGTPIKSVGSMDRLYSASKSSAAALPVGTSPSSSNAGLRGRTSTPGSPLLRPLASPAGSIFSAESSSSNPGGSLQARRRRHVSAGNSAVPPFSSPPPPPPPPLTRSPSIMSASDPRDLTLQFTRRKRPETLSRSTSSSLFSPTWSSMAGGGGALTRRATCTVDDEPCDSTEPEETDSDGEFRTSPYFEPSVFASPPQLTPTTSLASTASSASPKTTTATTNEPAAGGRSNSLGYWSIYSSASGSSTHARSSTSTSEADQTRTLQTKTTPNAVAAAAGGATRKSSLPSLQMTAARTLVHAGVPSGLVQAIPLSPLVPPHAQELQPPLAPPPSCAAALPSRPSQLTLAHLAIVNPPSSETARPAVASSKKKQGGGGAANSDRLDLTRLRREQLARRRAAAVEFELEGEDGDKDGSGGGDAAEAKVAAPTPPLPPRTGRASTTDMNRDGKLDPTVAAAWEDEVLLTLPPRRGPVERSQPTTAPFPPSPTQGAPPRLLRRVSAQRGGPRL